MRGIGTDVIGNTLLVVLAVNLHAYLDRVG